MFYNYPRMIKEIYALMALDAARDSGYTLNIMLDETVMHFLEEHNVSSERQAEFLAIMLYDCPQAVNDYKNKKFDFK